MNIKIESSIHRAVTYKVSLVWNTRDTSIVSWPARRSRDYEEYNFELANFIHAIHDLRKISIANPEVERSEEMTQHGTEISHTFEIKAEGMEMIHIIKSPRYVTRADAKKALKNLKASAALLAKTDYGNLFGD